MEAHPINNSKAVSVIPLQNVCTHESEDGHNVVGELLGNEWAELGEEKEGLVGGLRVGRCYSMESQSQFHASGEGGTKKRTSHKIKNRCHADRIARNVARGLQVKESEYPSRQHYNLTKKKTNLNVFHNLGQRAEHELSSVLNIDLLTRRQLNKRRQELKERQQQVVRNLDGREVEGFEDDDELGKAFCAGGA